MREGEELEFGPHRLSASLVASAPLFLAYEIGSRATGVRNTSEILAMRAFAFLGERALLVRAVLLVLGFALSLVVALRTRDEADAGAGSLRASCVRQLAEGLVAALVLGPLLVGALSLFDVRLAGLASPPRPGSPPPLTWALRVVGGAGWEELVFRLGAYAALYVLAVRSLGFFGLSSVSAAPAGDLVALLGSSVLFAAFHLDLLTRLFGVRGEPFDHGVFLWRLLAGLALAALFRWRGFAVAAWAHGILNGALFLGAGPGVLA